jgi:MFS family permease
MAMDMSVAGAIAGLISLTALFCRPLSGFITDRMNKVMVLKVASLLMAVGISGYVFSTSPFLMSCSRILNGIGFAINSTAIVSLSVEFIPKNRIGEGLGYLTLAAVVCEAGAPGIGIAIANSSGEKTVFIMAAISCILAFLIYYFLKYDFIKKESDNSKISWRDIISPEVFGYSFISSIFSMSNGIISTYLLVYAREINITNISLFFIVNAVVMIIIRPFTGKIMDKYGLLAIGIPGTIAMAVSMFLLGYAGRFGSQGFVIIMVSAVLRAIGKGSVQPALQAASILKVGQNRSGVASSTVFLGADIVQGIGPMIAGVIVGIYAERLTGYVTVFYFLAGLFIFDMFVFIFVQYWGEISNKYKSEVKNKIR